ncbi:MAG: EAL domain-containing protein [Spirochaetales bacterium]|nr:EAL domain-containing protein [Leptospiraceae bacterium]MCP5481680.1 EAL domain-containing protein [Spirochaetales bacterium]
MTLPHPALKTGLPAENLAILVVEDDRDQAEFLVLRLKAIGYDRVDLASTGEAALRAVESNPPDMILMDVGLPGGLDGIDTARKLGQLGLPVVYMTARADLDLVERAQSTHPFGLLIKPFSERELELTLKMAIVDHRRENRLNEALDELNIILENMPAAVAFVKGRRFMRINSSFEQLFDASRADVIGQLGSLLFPSEKVYRDFLRSSLIALRNHGQFRTETPLVTLGGRDLWCYITGRVLHSDNLRDGVIWIIEDFTDRARVAAALKESEERYRLIFEQNQAISLLIDPTHGTILNANEAATRFYGYSREELLGRSIDTINVLTPEEIRAAMHLAMENDQNYFVFRHRLKSGEIRDVEVYSTPVKQDEKTVLHSIVHDITERMRSREILKLNARVFESTLEGVWITDAEKRTITVNRAFGEITGYESEEIIGRLPPVLRPGAQDPAFLAQLWEGVEQTGSWQGEIRARRRDGQEYPEWLAVSEVRDETRTLTNYIGVFSDISTRKQAEERLSFMATHDSLTGLPNRTYILDHIQDSIKKASRGQELALLFLDLDQFKVVNDSLGHHVGDELLNQAAERLSGCLRETDTLARLGGDEFIVLLEGEVNAEIAATIAREIIASVERPFRIAGQELFVSISIGVCFFPRDGQNEDALIQNADTAMYRAKAKGRNNFQFYTDEMNARIRERMQIENDLRRALETQDELVLHYQPMVHRATGLLCGMEALVRWHHPERGLLLPGAFIPFAEESALIITLGEWVLRTAALQNRKWMDAGLPTVPVSMNLSARHMQRADLPGTVARILKEIGLDPAYLDLEITESCLLEEPEIAIASMRALAGMGTQLSIDDFGTGYSSLSYLSRLPIHTVKIDGSFLKGVPGHDTNQAIIAAIASIAHNLRLSTVVEGVETPEQLDFVSRLGLERIQGFLFSRALPPADMMELLGAMRSGAMGRTYWGHGQA